MICQIITNLQVLPIHSTAFIIQKETAYFLVTAKHAFLPCSTQADFTVPTVHDSVEDVVIVDPIDNKILHKEPVINNNEQKIFYKTFFIDEDKALDIAVLKLSNLPENISTEALSYDLLRINNTINEKSQLSSIGYPTKISGIAWITCKYLADEKQQLLDENSKYFFIVQTEQNLKGISGGPIVLHENNKILSIVGIFVGQNSKILDIGYAIFSSYIKAIIDQYA